MFIRPGSNLTGWRRIFVICCVIISCVALFVGLMLQMEREPRHEEILAAGALPTAIANVGSREILVELAMTDAAIVQGLSDRLSLSPDHGMLFIFDHPAVQYFWMKDMFFPLDMIFLRDGTVVDVHADVPHPANSNGVPTIVTSKTEADQVLEINAGKAKEWGIVEGTKVEVYR